MSRMRFNHMELTFAPGTLTDDFRREVDNVFVDLLGWRAFDVQVIGQRAYLLQPDDGQFILLAEGSKWMTSPGYDHLGLLLDTREEVDELLEACQKFADTDDRMQLKLYDDLVLPTVTVHAFYFRYLLPIWFDVQSMEHQPGREPTGRWQYV
jgi:hypothetical protein